MLGSIMVWIKHNLKIIEMYGMKTIDFTNAYNSFTTKLLKLGYGRVLDLCCVYGQHRINLQENNFTIICEYFRR